MQPARRPIDTETANRVVLALQTQAPLVDDTDLRDRIVTSGEVARLLQWSDDQIETEGTRREVASFHLQRLAVQLGQSLLAYLRSEPLPSWEGLPRRLRSHGQY